jgi:nitrogen-specific signal transduction histidine kinase
LVAKVSLFARRAGFNAGATVANGLLLSVLLYRTAPRLGLLLWLSLQLGGASWLYYGSRRKRRTPRGSARGVRRAVFACTVAGLSLGSVVLLLEGSSDFARLLVFITLAAMASAASTILAPIPRAAQGYIGGALALPAVFWLYQGQLEYAVLAGLSLSMIFFLVRNARVTHETFLEGLGRARQIEALRARFQSEQAEWLDLSRATEAFALLDPEDRVLLWNARFEQLMHPARVERGAPYAALLADATLKPSTVDGRPVSHDGWLELRSALVTKGADLLEGYPSDVFYRVSAQRLASGCQALLAVNVTALKRAERGLYEGELALARTQRQESVGIMAGGVAHDFNNLLTVVGGAAELLSSEVQSPHGRALLADIASSVERGSRLTRQLLAYGRRQALNPCTLDLNQLIERNLPLFRRLLPATIQIRTELAPELWSVFVDPEQIEQVAMNLVLNARDAMPLGGQLQLSTKNTESTCIELWVEDTGVGMTPEMVERIFEPFFSTKDKHRGSGLGLSAVQGIVRQSGGSISVETRLNEGTKMKIRLPRCDGADVDRPVAGASQPAPAARREQLLVVDDEGRVLEVTASLLRRLGYAVLEAQTPAAALGLLEMHVGKIALLLTDVVMPVMNGAELAIAARRIVPDLAVVFMSGYDPGLLEQFETPDVLRKPFSPEQLAAVVATALSARTPRPERSVEAPKPARALAGD